MECCTTGSVQGYTCSFVWSYRIVAGAQRVGGSREGQPDVAAGASGDDERRMLVLSSMAFELTNKS